MSRASGFARARARARKRVSSLEFFALQGIEDTVDDVHTEARQNIRSMVKRRSGVLSRNYRKSINRRRVLGRVGYLTKNARRKAFYARFVHDGTRYMVGRPFHDLAVDMHEARHLARMRRALKKSL